MIVLFSLGWRLSDDFTLEKRGGIYVALSQTGADILIDWDVYHTTQFLSRDYLKQNLEEGEHEVEVRHPDYYTWYRKVDVKPERVTDLYPFLVPEEYVLREIAQEVVATSTSDISQTISESVDEYTRVDALFNIVKMPTTTPEIRNIDTLLVDALVQTTPTTTPDTAKPSELLEGQYIRNHETVVWYDGYTIYAYWNNENWKPERFCNSVTCVNPMPVLTRDERITHVDFYPGRDDVILFTLPDGIYVAEIDKRPWPVHQRILFGEGIDFRIEGNNLYVKDGKVIVEVKI